jgi:hypothetical protein
MTTWLHADISQVDRVNWRGYLRELDLHFSGSTKALAEYAAYQAAENSEGLKSFSILFTEV